mgnify:CR=1 FL=1
MLFKKLSLILVILFFVTKLIAAEEIKNNGNQLNFFTGNLTSVMINKVHI